MHLVMHIGYEGCVVSRTLYVYRCKQGQIQEVRKGYMYMTSAEHEDRGSEPPAGSRSSVRGSRGEARC